MTTEATDQASRCASAPSFYANAAVGAAGLAGAAGVALAAVAAHRVDSPGLESAAYMLLFHAAAVLALVALGRDTARPCVIFGVAAAMLAAVAVFSGSIAAHVLLGFHVPMLAPIGGSGLIASWLVLALLGLASALRRRG